MAGGEGGRGFACDAAITPVVTGDINVAVLEDLVRLCVQLAGHGPGRCAPGEDDTAPGAEETSRHGTGPQPPTGRGREALEQAIIGKTMNLLMHSRYVI